MFGTTLFGKCLRFVRADSIALTDSGVTAADVDPAVAFSALTFMAVAVPTGRAILQWKKDRDGDKPELEISPDSVPDSVKSIFEVLADARNGTVSGDLDAELADLMDEPDWSNVNRRLDDAVKKWCQDCDAGAGNPLDEQQMFNVLLSLIRNVREAPYRDEFANHYRRIFSVDRRDRSEVNDVFVRLETDVRRDAPYELDVPEYLDFRGATPTDIETTLRRLTDDHNLVILGEPGSGKSTLLRYLALSCAQSESADPLLPVFLPLRAYAGGEDILIADSALTFAEEELQVAMPDGFFEDALGSGRCLVCLDALDEVPAVQRYDIVRKVERLAGRYPDSRFIVTSRHAGYDDAPLGEKIFTRYDIQPMDDDDIAAFIDRLCAGDRERAQNLRNVLNANPSIKALASNPLLLTILGLVYREDQREGLPLKTAGLYKRAIAELLNDEDFEVDRDTRNSTFFKYREDILVAVAYYLHTQGSETIGRNPLAREVARFLINEDGINMGPREARLQAQAFVELAEQRTGLLLGEQVGRATEFRFLHSTFREYLAAQHIYLKHFSDEPDVFWEEIKEHVTDFRWREVLLFLLSGFSDDDEEYATFLTRQILSSGDNTNASDTKWRITTHLQLAADALINQAPMSAELQREIADRLARIAKGVDFPLSVGVDVVARPAVDTLSAIRNAPETAAVALTAIATDSKVHPDTRMRAALVLGEFSIMATATSVLSDIANDPTLGAKARVAAARALGGLGRTDAAVPTLAAISTDPAVADGVRVDAARALGDFGEREAAILTLMAIIDDPACLVIDRVAAAGGLGHLDERDAAVPFLSSVATDPARWGINRVDAARELVRLGEGNDAVAALAAVAADPTVHDRVRRSAAQELEGLDERDDAIAALTAIATDPTVSNNIRRIVVRELEHLSGRDGAITALTRIGNRAAFGAAARLSATKELMRLGERNTAMLTLADIATDSSVRPRDRSSAAAELGHLGERDTPIATLTAVATDATVDDMTRVSAAVRLEQLGYKEAAIATLTVIVGDPAVSIRMRVDAAWGLGRLGDKKTAETILHPIADDESLGDFIRRAAREALQQLNEE